MKADQAECVLGQGEATAAERRGSLLSACRLLCSVKTNLSVITKQFECITYVANVVCRLLFVGTRRLELAFSVSGFYANCIISMPYVPI